MRIGGIHPLTLQDFPGHVACILFTQGCNLRCSYCHNPQFIPLEVPGRAAISAEQTLAFLDARRGLLDGVVVSGGEPTLQPDLLPFLRRVKQDEFLVKLDTNGTCPDVLAEAVAERLLDYVAMDLKHDPARYAELTQVAVDPAVLAASRDVLRRSGIAHEFRTTVVPHVHDAAAVESMARFCAGAPLYVLQPVRPTGTAADSTPDDAGPSDDLLRHLHEVAQRYLARVEIRGDSTFTSKESEGRIGP